MPDIMYGGDGMAQVVRRSTIGTLRSMLSGEMSVCLCEVARHGVRLPSTGILSPGDEVSRDGMCDGMVHWSVLRRARRTHTYTHTPFACGVAVGVASEASPEP